MSRLPLALLLALSLQACTPSQPSVLVFSKTAGYRHASIEPGIEAIRALGANNGFMVESTEDSLAFNEANLERFDAIIFLSTTLDVLGTSGQIALQRYVQAGGGYVGIHAASDTEYDWPWYGRLVGGYFISHPPGIHEAELTVVDAEHASTAHLPSTWVRTDEWYDIRHTTREINVLLDIDETTYKTEEQSPNPVPRPIAWYQEFEGGRSFYTALGHTDESYSEPAFLDHILGGIRWAIGEDPARDFAQSGVRPTDDDFEVTALADSLNEPMELDFLPDGRVLFIERGGDLHLVDPSTGRVSDAGRLDVFTGLEDGLLGLAVDPSHAENGWVYLFYSPASQESGQRVSRFSMTGGALDLTTEVVLLDIDKQRIECCHSGGSLQFGPDRLLYISVGDDSNPFGTPYAPMDERPDRLNWDAQRTAANTADLRGKILRLQITEDGEATIPEGNLFPVDGSRGRAEIFVMGNRNPFRIHVDQRTGWLYWGEIGPDAGEDDESLGPRGYDEINQARGPGNFGWPYFIADNLSYGDHDFATGKTGFGQSPAAPFNESPNNTGMQALPPAQGAFIWYPYARSPRFPLFGEGGRSAMAGPVFHQDEFQLGDGSFPAYYENTLLVHEWMRNKIYAVHMDRGLQYDYMETFLPTFTFSRPMDMEFDPSGVLYVIDYGQVWNRANPDARLLRIAFKG